MPIDPTTPEGRAELRELLSKATRPGPWAYGEDEDGEATIYWQPNPGSRLIHDLSEWDGADQDAELAVAAVNALPALLDALDAAEKNNSELFEVSLRYKHRANEFRGEDRYQQSRAGRLEAALDRVRALVSNGDILVTPKTEQAMSEFRAALDGEQ